MLSNTVPLRLATAPGDRLAGVVRDAAQQTRSALGHQRYAHETLRRDLGLEPTAADMFGTLVNVSSLQQTSLFGTTQGLTYNLSNGPVRDLSIVCYEAASAGMRVDLDGNTELYTAAELSRHGRRLLRLFDAIAGASPDTCLSELPLLDDAERADLDGLGSGAVAPPYRAVTSLIAAQVAARPEAPAVRAADGTELSHADLWAWSGAIAARLARLGDLRGKPIGLAAERGPGLIAGLLGILRMGGIVLPLDPTQPPSRLAQILAEAGPVAMLPSEVIQLIVTPAEIRRLADMPAPPGGSWQLLAFSAKEA
jgi:non-ribosomal peptide synthetase component F